jgi:hypothetical protein
MTDEARPQTKPFAQWLQEQRQGNLHGELSEGLAELVQTVMDTQRAGKLVITVTVRPNKDGVTCMVEDQHKVTLPKQDVSPSLFYTDEHGNLSRRDPRQPELPLKGVNGGQTNTAAGAATA